MSIVTVRDKDGRLGATRNGYSLIEVLLVLSLIGLAAASVSIRWSSIYRNARFESNVARVIDIDMKARRHAASRNQMCRLIYDLDAQFIRSSRWVESAEKLQTARLMGTTRIAEVRIPKLQSDSSTITLDISGNGAAATYAVRLMQQGNSRWIVFAGRTGQAEVYDEASEFDKAFAAIESQRFNAH